MGFKSRKKTEFNPNKGMRHWERMARDLVVRQLVRASEVDNRSIPGEIAQKRLLELAQAEDPKMFKAICEERDRCRSNLGKILSEIMGHDG